MTAPPDQAALLQQAMTAHQTGKLAEAEQGYRQILARDPKHVDALQLLGLIAHHAGHLGPAEDLIRQSLVLNPNQPAPWCNLGSLLMDAKRPEEALGAFDRALVLRPDYANAHSNRAVALTALSRHREALQSADRALALQPDNPEAIGNRSAALLELRRVDEALASAERALALTPNSATAVYNRAAALMKLKRFDEAMAGFARAVDLRPGYQEALFSEGLCRLITGDLAAGFEKFEWRWQSKPLVNMKPRFTEPRWTGAEDIAGKTLLIYAEQGFGDTIQFVRYAPLAAAKGARVIVCVPPALKTLFARADTRAEIITPDDPMPAFDYQCAMLSLPLALKTTLATVPGQARYLWPAPEEVAKWRARLPAGRRVGVVWAGNPGHGNDAARSMPVGELAPLLATGATLVSLQKDLRSGDQAWLREHPQVIHLGNELANFDDSAAVISLLDVMVSVDSAPAHLAAAMGRRTWILLPYMDTDWRWMLNRDDSPWYPSVRLFRQSAAGGWAEVIARVARELARSA